MPPLRKHGICRGGILPLEVADYTILRILNDIAAHIVPRMRANLRDDVGIVPYNSNVTRLSLVQFHANILSDVCSVVGSRLASTDIAMA